MHAVVMQTMRYTAAPSWRGPRAAYLETLVSPVSWAGETAPDPDLFKPLRSPAGTHRRLTAEEMGV